MKIQNSRNTELSMSNSTHENYNVIPQAGTKRKEYVSSQASLAAMAYSTTLINFLRQKSV